MAYPLLRSLLPLCVGGLCAVALTTSACGIQVVGSPGEDDDSTAPTTPPGDDDTGITPTPSATPVPLPEFAIDVSPQTLKFGSVTASTSASLEITYTNIGDKDITVREFSLTSSTGFFTYEPPPELVDEDELTLPVLSPGEGLILVVTFHPAYTGSFNAVLAMLSDDLENIPTVSMSGRGV